MSKKWSRLGLKIKAKKHQKSKTALYFHAAALGFALLIFAWNGIAGTTGNLVSMLLSMMVGVYGIPVVCALCGTLGGVFSVLALRNKESLKWSIPATLVSALLLFVGVFMTVRTFTL